MSINLSQAKIEIYNILTQFLGKDFVRKNYLNRSVKKYIKADCVFVHIPKAGGTSIANAIMGGRAGHFTSIEIQKVLGEKLYSELFSFSITRDPVDRIYSAYNYAMSGGGPDGGVKSEPYFDLPAFRSFDSFVQEWLVFQDLKETNLLFKPQKMFVLDELGNKNVNYIGKLEDINTVQNRLTKELGRPINLPKMNSGLRKDFSISNDSREIIKKLYADDYTLFNY